MNIYKVLFLIIFVLPSDALAQAVSDIVSTKYNSSKYKAEIFVDDDRNLDGFIIENQNFIDNSDSYISPSFDGKIINPQNASEVYSNSFDEDYILVFARTGKEKLFSGPEGANYFILGADSLEFPVAGIFNKGSKRRKTVELFKLQLTYKEWKTLATASNSWIEHYGIKIIIGEKTKTHMLMILSEVERLQKTRVADQ